MNFYSNSTLHIIPEFRSKCKKNLKDNDVNNYIKYF